MNTEDLSESAIRMNCPHCDRQGYTYQFLLQEYPQFCVVCDPHPLLEGHLLIIPKRHVSCIGAYTPNEFAEFKKIYSQIENWIRTTYGSVATFEHGIIGQTVFHSHVHLMPFVGNAGEIIPEGKVKDLKEIDQLFQVFREDNQYLFFSIGKKMWLADTSLGAPRFYRDRFSKALGRPERGNWKETRNRPEIMRAGDEENKCCQSKFFESVVLK